MEHSQTLQTTTNTTLKAYLHASWTWTTHSLNFVHSRTNSLSKITRPPSPAKDTQHPTIIHDKQASGLPSIIMKMEQPAI